MLPVANVPTTPTGPTVPLNYTNYRISDSVDVNGQYQNSSNSSYSGYQSNDNYGGYVTPTSSTNYPISYGSEKSYENDLYDHQINGTSGDDVLTGVQGNGDLKGGKGNDHLVGNIGHDKLEGGKGYDTLEGGNGNDYLDGGQGKDVLIGDAGNDQFVLKSKYSSPKVDSADTILDFQKGFDRIVLKDGLGVSNLNITQGTGLNANDTILNMAGTGQVLAVVKNVNSTTINGSDFILG